MDIQLPGMDGFEATRLIRQEEAETGRHTPIVAMTAHAMEEDRKRCLEAGMDDYVSKPIQAGLLRAVIDRQVSGSARAETPDGQERAADAPDREVFDRADLLDTLGGDAGCLAELVNMFIVDAPVQVAVLQRYLDKGQSDEVEARAHKLKGAAANIRARSMSKLLSDIEQAAIRNNLDEVPGLLEQLGNAFEIFKGACFSRDIDENTDR
jgi:CheY-like chemotaxis protein